MTVLFKYFYGKYVVCEGDRHLCEEIPLHPDPPLRSARRDRSRWSKGTRA